MQGKIYHFFLFYVIFLSIIIIGCSEKNDGDNITVKPKPEKDALTLQDAIEKGKETLKNCNYPFWNEELVISADDNNTVWEKQISINTPSAFDEDIKRLHLKERRYWAIYYYPRRALGNNLWKGGDAMVFIDRSDGKVIWFFLGQ